MIVLVALVLGATGYVLASRLSSRSSPRPVAGPAPGTADIYQVPDSIPSDCSKAVDAQIVKWIAGVPDRSVIVFGKDKCYGQNGTLVVTDRKDLTIDGNGATFKTLSKGAANRSSWRIMGGSGITLKDMTVRGSNPGRKYYHPKEWQHGYDFRGTVGGLLDNVRAYNTYGDGVSVGHDMRNKNPRSARPASNITVQDSQFERIGRMAVGLVNVDGFVIKHSYINDVALTAIDAEPDVEEQTVRNIRVLDNTFGYVTHAMFASVGFGGGPQHGNMLVEGNTMTGPVTGCIPPVLIQGPEGEYRSGYTIRHNRLLTRAMGVKAIRANNIRVLDNRIESTPGGCESPGVVLMDADDVALEGNLFSGHPRTLEADPPRVHIQDKDNLLAPETTPPTGATVTAPADGATVSGVVKMTATATDNHRINRIEFYNGLILLGNALQVGAGWEIDLDTRSLPNSALQLEAKAYDVSGNTELSPPVAINVRN